jgi:hypothetical protein
MAVPFKQKILSSFKDKTIDEFTREIELSGTVLTLKKLGI